ncbi:MAG: SUMF1/EgtB/PvdO family nonheme iron enzyme [Verrucomicrobia bacterium]|nr:SUMF1/EgtB/PvdO family nonheme iron enzyme [Verrucomicrobiota bacterium]
MKIGLVDCFGLAALVGIASVTPAFGLVSIDYVVVGDPGNAADTVLPASPRGAVDYTYQIGKYEVTNGQYAQFLNAVAKTDAYSLYNPSMGNAALRGGITQTGSNGSYRYTANTYMENRPVNYVSWFDAARFTNWMHNGQGSGSTETGAYTLNGAMTGKDFVVQAGAKVWIPSANEWYKAAYYDPTKSATQGGTNYWLYPTRSDTAPTQAAVSIADKTTSTGIIINSGTNVANYSESTLAKMPIYYAPGRVTRGYVTVVGSAGAASASYYGTFDQGGNVAEWNDNPSPTSMQRGLLGGAWSNPEAMLRSDGVYQTGPYLGVSLETDDVGFRVASVPESTSMVLALFAGAVLLTRRRRA